jgi:hypothetical protein
MTDAAALLLQLGFSEYEARAYLALVQRNPLNGYELAKVPGVPRANIYAVLQKLKERGGGRPSRPTERNTLCADRACRAHKAARDPVSGYAERRATGAGGTGDTSRSCVCLEHSRLRGAT